MPAIDQLADQITRVETSVDTIIAKLEELKGGNVDPAVLQAFTARLTAVADKLDAATGTEGGGEAETPPA